MDSGQCRLRTDGQTGMIWGRILGEGISGYSGRDIGARRDIRGLPPGMTGAENLAWKDLKFLGFEFPNSRRIWTAAMLYVHSPCNIAPGCQLTMATRGSS